MIPTDKDDAEFKVCGRDVLVAMVAVTLLAFFYARSSDDFIPLIDHANLAFHEAGHVFFGLLGSTLALYGGTLGQLVFPVAVSATFWRKRQALSFAVGLIWLFQNLINIARYMADARAHQLPLVGGGDHDWTNILLRWNALSSDTGMAKTLSVIAWLGILATLLWLLGRWLGKSSDRSRGKQEY